MPDARPDERPSVAVDDLALGLVDAEFSVWISGVRLAETSVGPVVVNFAYNDMSVLFVDETGWADFSSLNVVRLKGDRRVADDLLGELLGGGVPRAEALVLAQSVDEELERKDAEAEERTSSRGGWVMAAFLVAVVVLALFGLAVIVAAIAAALF